MNKTKNIQRPTSNIQHRTNYFVEEGEEAQRAEDGVFDLEDRLLDYAAAMIRLVEELPKTRAGNHLASQLLRSGTSPLPNHGEAESAESPADFIHKLKVSLKELRETKRWLRLVMRVPLLPTSAADPLLAETIELIRIFVASIRTAERHAAKPASRYP
jgi:four helix bundle protein